MKTFYVTFGVQYPREPHPLYDDAHHDGWVTIEAPSWEGARDVAFALFGPHWAFCYTELDFKHDSFFPLGELAYVFARDVTDIVML